MQSPLHILSARLGGGETPVSGVPLEPYILVRRADGTTVSAEEVPQEGQTDSRFSIKCRWYRSVITKAGQVCWVHPERDAAIQCILCLRCKADTKRSYHCSPECLKEHWTFHNDFHTQNYRNGESSGHGHGHTHAHGSTSAGNGYGSSADLRHASLAYSYSNSGEAFIEVGRTRAYLPTPEDVGCTLKFECTAYDVASSYQDVGKTFSIVTARVRPAPNPPRRPMVSITPPHPSVTKGAFTVLSYNLLADLYASVEHFSYCPPWALAWPYRKVNLLRELLAYKADVLCLQEVQSNHFTEFLAPEMAKAGYTAIYKKKTTEMYTRNAYAIDGCATFFRRDKFSLVKKYEVEFNKAALSLAEALPPEQKKAALNRLLKDNVALIAVLEALDPPFGGSGSGGSGGGGTSTTTNNNNSSSSAVGEGGTTNTATTTTTPTNNTTATGGGSTSSRRQLVCIANTHIHSNPELGDVKLWQVHTLLKGLEKIAASADIPMLVAGDFNATPSSAAHSLLVQGSVPPSSSELLNDPLGILKPVTKLFHRLPLASAYQSVAACPDTSHTAMRQKRRLDGTTGEPRFTNITKDFKGTLDYILYSKDSLVPSAALELVDETEVVRSKAQPGLPNDQWSSDHVALMVEFQYRDPSSSSAAAGGGGKE